MNSIAGVGIERLLERAVRAARVDSPRAVALLTQLKGRTLAVSVTGIPRSFTIACDGQSLLPGSAGDLGVSSADATITGSPLSLMTLAGPDPQSVITRGDVQIAGDAEIAQQFRELAMLLKPDLEVGLSRLLGRSGAHIAIRGLNAMRDWARTTTWTATQNVAEYLAHERGDVVSRSEAEHFLRGVDQLREQLDRLAARLQHLESRSDSLTPHAPDRS